jgi:hypothetical protein
MNMLSTDDEADFHLGDGSISSWRIG